MSTWGPPGPRAPGKRVRLSVEVSTAWREWLKELAKSEGVTVAELFSRAMYDYTVTASYPKRPPRI